MVPLNQRISQRQRLLKSHRHRGILTLHENMLDVLEKRDEERIAETVKDHYQFWRRQIAKYAK